jgi:nucleotide-binding universal stress UspA family protein
MVHAIELAEAASEAEAETRVSSVSRKMAQGRLEALANGVRRLGIDVETHVDEGDPYSVIMNACNTYRVDLLVLGIHGVHRGVDHLLIGSNTEKILLSANCPVLTVGAHVLSGVDLDLQLGEVMYFSDLSPQAAAAAPYAAFFGQQFHAPVEIFQLLPEGANEDDPATQQLLQSYCDSMKAALGDPDSDWCRPGHHLQRGTATAQMIERAQSQHTGLIVLGVHAESHFGMRLHTSFAYRLLARATCPVLSVRVPPPGSSQIA